MDDAAERAHQSMVDRDWPALRPLLHPYLHWTGPDNVTIRRTRVLAMLSDRANPPEPPASVELRANQIYRWSE